MRGAAPPSPDARTARGARLACAHLVLLDRQGRVRWRGHGPFREAEFTRLEEEVRRLAP